LSVCPENKQKTKSNSGIASEDIQQKTPRRYIKNQHLAKKGKKYGKKFAFLRIPRAVYKMDRMPSPLPSLLEAKQNLDKKNWLHPSISSFKDKKETRMVKD